MAAHSRGQYNALFLLELIRLAFPADFVSIPKHAVRPVGKYQTHTHWSDQINTDQTLAHYALANAVDRHLYSLFAGVLANIQSQHEC